LEGFGGEGRGGNIFNLMYLVQFLGGEGRDEEGSKLPHKLTFCFPPNWGDLEGREALLNFIKLTKLSSIYYKISMLPLL
jgi:hypothetical protein